LVKYR